MRVACTAFCERPDLGAKLFRAPSWRRSPRVAAPTMGAACTAFSGRSDLGPKLSQAPSWRHSPRVAAPTNEGGVHCFLWEARPGAKLFGHRAGAVRRGSRLPQMRAAWTAFCGRPDLGAKHFQTPSWRHSPRVAAPTMGAACTAFFVGGPPSGRSFSGTELAPFAAMSRLPQWWRRLWFFSFARCAVPQRGYRGGNAPFSGSPAVGRTVGRF